MPLLDPVIAVLVMERGGVPESSQIPGAKAKFTWADLSRLRGKLVIAPDSSCVPDIIKDNIIRTIKYVLNPHNASGKPPLPLCKEVSIQDLYHGHIALPINPRIPEDLRTKVIDFQTKYNAAIDQAFPDATLSTPPSAAEREAIRRADADTLEDFKSLLTLIVTTLPKASIIYHTYELSTLRVMEETDPRRNILMPFSGINPFLGAYFSTDAKVGGQYSDVLKLNFLVSPNGEVFVRGPNNASIEALEF